MPSVRLSGLAASVPRGRPRNAALRVERRTIDAVRPNDDRRFYLTVFTIRAVAQSHRRTFPLGMSIIRPPTSTHVRILPGLRHDGNVIGLFEGQQAPIAAGDG
jgi:hypothetical protein